MIAVAVLCLICYSFLLRPLANIDCLVFACIVCFNRLSLPNLQIQFSRASQGPAIPNVRTGLARVCLLHSSLQLQRATLRRLSVCHASFFSVVIKISSITLRFVACTPSAHTLPCYMYTEQTGPLIAAVLRRFAVFSFSSLALSCFLVVMVRKSASTASQLWPGLGYLITVSFAIPTHPHPLVLALATKYCTFGSASFATCSFFFLRPRSTT